MSNSNNPSLNEDVLDEMFKQTATKISIIETIEEKNESSNKENLESEEKGLLPTKNKKNLFIVD